MTTRMVLAAALLAVVGLTGCTHEPASAENPNLIATLDAYVRVLNAHDIDAALAFYSDDAHWEYPYMMSDFSAEKSSFARALELDAALGTRTEIRDCQQAGHEVTCTYIERNSWMDMHGVESWSGADTVIVFDSAGKIERIRFGRRDDVAWSKLKPVWIAFETWASESHPEELARMRAPGERRVRWSREAGDVMLALGKAWVDAGRPGYDETVAKLAQDTTTGTSATGSE